MTRSPSRRFAYQMAVRLGKVNVDAMLRSITAKQFAEWQAYARLEPFTEQRADWRTASIVKALFDLNQKLIDALFAVNGAERSKRPKIVTSELKDFLLTWKSDDDVKPTRRHQTWQEQLEIVQMIVHAHSVPGVNP